MNTAAIDTDLLRRYRYLFDLGGNRTQEIATVAAATTTNDYEYTSANQIYRRRVNAGAWTNFTYDNNGNLTNDGTNTYTWDRANRLKQRGLNYTYDGYGNRFQGDVTKYLLDIQPGLSEVIREEDTGSHGGFYGPPYFVHGLRGLHTFNRVNSSSGARYWTWPLEDGLGSVRVNVDSAGGVLESRNYDPYGNSFNPTGTSQTDYGFTGEPTDSNGLLYLRTRYYSPTIGVFTTLDPFEGMASRPMSLNGYSWVEGNVPNKVDRSGKCPPFLEPLVQTTYQTVKEYHPSFPELLREVNGEIPRGLGELTCFAYDAGEQLGPHIQEITTATGATFTAAVEIFGAATVGIVVASAALVGLIGLAIYLDVTNHVDVYTPDMLRGMRIPELGSIVTPTPNPNATVQPPVSTPAAPQPQLQPLPTPESTLAPQQPLNPCGTPTIVPTQTDEPKFIYRQARDSIRPQAVALRRESDFITGLSFNENLPSGLFLKYRESDLSFAGFEVRHRFTHSSPSRQESERIRYCTWEKIWARACNCIFERYGAMGCMVSS